MARTVLIDGIGSLVTNDPSLGEGLLGIVTDAAIVVTSDRIEWVGRRAELGDNAADERIDAEGCAVIPGFVESHSHLAFAGERADEFVARMAGLPYAAGGIRSTIAKTRAATTAELGANVTRLVAEYRAQGTTTIECKSGYGQTTPDELRSLEAMADQVDERTLLAAHVVPPEFAGRTDDYVTLVTDEMIPACAPHAGWIDVFCEVGAFDYDQSKAVLQAGAAAGLGLRVHGNQLHQGPGIQLAVELGAASVDHVCHASTADVEALAASDTVATLLPAADFSTRNAYPDARRLLGAGVTIALGADCNPGTSYTTSMAFCIALAVRELRLTPDEALLAATLGGAKALRRTDVGAVRPGMRADLAFLAAPSHVHLAYRPGVPLVSRVLAKGVIQ